MKEWILDNYQWIITSFVTIIGLTITYLGVKNNFRYEVSKLKQEVSLNTMQEIPYKICDLMDRILNTTKAKKPIGKDIDNLMKEILSRILCYGTKDAVTLAIFMQQTAYKNAKGESLENNNNLIYVYSLLIAQIKYDLTSEIILADSYLRLRLNDYDSNKKQFIDGINATIDELNLNKKFKL
jgi:hypothetical protein